jgi:hypothetical protein
MGKKRVVKFESVHEAYPDVLVPSKTTVPKWYKDEKHPGDLLSTFKKCTPFLESMLAGYEVLLPVDILVTQTNTGARIDWRQQDRDFRMVGFRLNESVDRIPTPHGYQKDSFYWHFPVCFELPVGYSALITQPINRFELPFQTLSVVIDGGYTLVPEARVTFFLREGFEGIIPQGTPIAQVIPYKNDNWVAEKTQGLVKKGEMSRKKSDSVYNGWYKNTWWVKKYYN